MYERKYCDLSVYSIGNVIMKALTFRRVTDNALA